MNKVINLSCGKPNYQQLINELGVGSWEILIVFNDVIYPAIFDYDGKRSRIKIWPTLNE